MDGTGLTWNASDRRALARSVAILRFRASLMGESNLRTSSVYSVIIPIVFSQVSTS